MNSEALQVWWVGLGLLLLSQVGLWLVLFQVVQQQGRVLLRLDELGRASPGLLPIETNGRAAQPTMPQGLPVGTAVAPFGLPDLVGQEVALGDFRGRKVLLVHWSPSCGFRALIAPDLAELHPELQEAKVPLLLVGRGSPPRLERATP